MQLHNYTFWALNLTSDKMSYRRGHFLQCRAVSWTYLFWVRGFGCPSIHTCQLSSRATAWSPEYNFAKFPPPVALFSPCSLLSFPTPSCTRTMPTFWACAFIFLWMCCSVGLISEVWALTNLWVCSWQNLSFTNCNWSCALEPLRLIREDWNHDALKCPS